jgi:8-oxo-dGTP pyrophosphatase MutT (NUDIX family)
MAALPAMPGTGCGAVAQMGERCNRTAEVRGSIPLSSTTPGTLSTISKSIPRSGVQRLLRLDVCRPGGRLSPPLSPDPALTRYSAIMPSPPAAIPAAIPAATLIIIRDRIGHPPDLLMVERAKTMAFAGGALVFPGGRIDPGDEALAASLGAGDDGAARIAAIRETIEEAGVAIGVEPPPSPAVIATLRRRLHAGDTLAVALDGSGLHLALDQLHAFTRWLPADRHARIFDTRFFLARAPDDAAASVDHTENVRLLWTSAAQLLADAAAGAAMVIFPTRRDPRHKG